jgi:hypothetical protein
MNQNRIVVGEMLQEFRMARGLKQKDVDTMMGWEYNISTYLERGLRGLRRFQREFEKYKKEMNLSSSESDRLSKCLFAPQIDQKIIDQNKAIETEVLVSVDGSLNGLPVDAVRRVLDYMVNKYLEGYEIKEGGLRSLNDRGRDKRRD